MALIVADITHIANCTLPVRIRVHPPAPRLTSVQVGSLWLVVNPSYSKSATGELAATSDIIDYELVITNTGLLDVFNISVTAWADGAGIQGSLACEDGYGEQVGVSVSSTEVGNLAPYPDEGLHTGEFLTCAFTAAVGQAEVR